MKNIEVVAAIIHKNDCIFVTQRGYGEFKDRWEFPGGKVEPGESYESALVREIREELDVEIKVQDLFYTVDCEYPDFHLIMHCFHCVIVMGNIILKEHEDARWLKKEELRTLKWLPADQEVATKLIIS